MLPKLTSLVLDFGGFTNTDFCSAMFQHPFLNLCILHLLNLNKVNYQSFSATVNQGQLHRLIELGLSTVIYSPAVTERKDFQKLPNLTQLAMIKFHSPTDHFSSGISKLHKLYISYSSGITGHLSILLDHSFPSLNSLILSNCGLNSQDLCSLAQASVEGRLPQLKHLDISENTNISD